MTMNMTMTYASLHQDNAEDRRDGKLVPRHSPARRVFAQRIKQRRQWWECFIDGKDIVASRAAGRNLRCNVAVDLYRIRRGP